MTEMTPEFKAQFHSEYGINMGRRRPDYSRCAEEVHRGYSFHQCTRKNGHGPHGAWCKQHDPIAVKAKADAAKAKWRAEWDAKKAAADFQKACIDAVKAIADGHNDPRGLCIALLAEQNGSET